MIHRPPDHTGCPHALPPARCPAYDRVEWTCARVCEGANERTGAGWAGNRIPTQDWIWSHQEKKTRDCRADRGEADRRSFPPSASPVRPPVTPPEQPMTWFVVIFVELFWQLLFAFSLLTASACSLLMTIPESRVRGSSQW